ncbi:MAG TPA: hypothetical protein VGQ71_12740, partial [Terriglobales bacterium]|nr:hypothetical protein [Terriglobales bacterium]
RFPQERIPLWAAGNWPSDCACGAPRRGYLYHHGVLESLQFLPKPFVPAQLADEVRCVLDQHE